MFYYSENVLYFSEFMADEGMFADFVDQLKNQGTLQGSKLFIIYFSYCVIVFFSKKYILLTTLFFSMDFIHFSCEEVLYPYK